MKPKKKHYHFLHAFTLSYAKPDNQYLPHHNFSTERGFLCSLIFYPSSMTPHQKLPITAAPRSEKEEAQAEQQAQAEALAAAMADLQRSFRAGSFYKPALFRQPLRVDPACRLKNTALRFRDPPRLLKSAHTQNKVGVTTQYTALSANRNPPSGS